MGSLIMLFSIITLLPTALADWTKENTQVLRKGNLEVVCVGEGPSLELARSEAKLSCNNLASQHLIKDVKVQSSSIETTSGVSFHSQISSDAKLLNFNCIPVNEKVEYLESYFRVWVKCIYDLDKVSVQTIEEDEVISPKVKKKKKSNFDFKQGNYIKDKTRVISLSSLPKCQKVSVYGQYPRVVDCEENPMYLKVSEGDQKIIVEAAGFTPAEVDLRNISGETIDIILER